MCRIFMHAFSILMHNDHHRFDGAEDIKPTQNLLFHMFSIH